MLDVVSFIEEVLMGKIIYMFDVMQVGIVLCKIFIEIIQDVCSLGIDLLLVLCSGGQILLWEGVLDVLVNLDWWLQFSDGVLILQQIFMQSEQFDFLY